MSEDVLKILSKDRAGVIENLREKFRRMVKVHGENFRYETSVVMIRYIKNKRDANYYQKMARSSLPEERFLITVITEIIQFSKTEAETFSIFNEFLFWIVQDFGREESNKLTMEERGEPTLFVGPKPNSVH